MYLVSCLLGVSALLLPLHVGVVHDVRPDELPHRPRQHQVSLCGVGGASVEIKYFFSDLNQSEKILQNWI